MTPNDIRLRLRTRETIESEHFVTKIFEVELSAAAWHKFFVITVGASKDGDAPDVLNISECGDEPQLIEKKLWN